jgi:hypothetical protein
MKTITMLIAGIFFSMLVNAQFTPGIKLGLNSAHLTGFSGNDRVGIHAGVFLHHTITPNWCVQPEILYSMEGQKYFDNGEERTLALNYIQVPVMFQYYPVRHFYLEFGPQFGVLLSATDKGSDGETNAKSDFTSGQIGLDLGAGIHLTREIALYGRYCFGLTDVSKFDNIVDHSQVGQLGIAVRLNQNR